MSDYHREQCLHLWTQIGGGEEGEGSVSIAEIVKHARYLERTFPELLQRYSEVAVHGSVQWEVFEKLYLGMPTSPGSPSDSPDLRRRPREELKTIFDAIDDEGTGSISLNNLIRHQDTVTDQLPEVLTRWSEIDSDDSGSISWDEFRYFFGDVDNWLEFQLSKVVGLEDLKQQICSFYRGVMLDKARRKRGHDVAKDGARYHMIFQGNPGTGKTSMGRLMAQLLHRVGIAPKDSLSEVQKESLVAGYVGQTAPKTQKVIEDAVGGMLFIDEAYRLSEGEKNEFGKEAIEQLMGAMNDPPSKAPIMLFAGYPEEMKNFMAQNDGLYRRVPYTFDFPNYSCAELAEILEQMVTKRGFELERRLLEHGRQRLSRIIETKTVTRTRSLMNGGLCERIFAFAKQELDARDDPEHPSIILSEKDVSSACERIPPPPDPGGKDDAESDSGNEGELQLLREHSNKMQAELEKLQKENAHMKREASQQLPAMSNVTLQIPSGGGHVDPNATMTNATVTNATMFGHTAAQELKGIQELLREVRRLKTDLKERDEEVESLKSKMEKLEQDNKRLSQALDDAKNNRQRLAPGTKVQYFSGSLQKWIDAVVQSYNENTGTYDLDVKREVLPDRVRIIEITPKALEAPKALEVIAETTPKAALAATTPSPSAAGHEDTHDNESDARRVAALFRGFDRNGDGLIDRRELADVLQVLDESTWSNRRVGLLLKALDTNQDKHIQYREFVDWVFHVNSVHVDELQKLPSEEMAFGHVLAQLNNADSQ